MSRPGEALAATLEEPGFFSGDPFPHYARLRAEAPVAWNAQLGYWALSRHADVMTVSKDSDTFCSGRGILTFEIGVEYASPPTMMHTDPPEHTRYRKLVQPAFAPSRMRALEARVRARARELVEKCAPDDPFDFVEQVAVPFPLWIIGELLGIPESDWHDFYLWSEAAIPGAQPEWTDQYRQQLMADMHGYLLEMTRTRRGDPRDDVISVLANVEVDGESLSDDELVMFLNQLLVAGNETTRHSLSGGIWALANDPDLWRRWRAGEVAADDLTEEVLRWTTPVISFMRTATRDTELSGVPIVAGDPVLMLYASANRDERVFGRSADRFVPRAPNPHVAFGFGHHFCLGAALARMEIRAMLEELATRYETLAPAGELERSSSFVIAGIKRAPVLVS